MGNSIAGNKNNECKEEIGNPVSGSFEQLYHVKLDPSAPTGISVCSISFSYNLIIFYFV